MILIDTNALVILLIGLIDPKILKDHKRTSIYDETDYNNLLSAIGDLEELVVLPNVWTETDNLLNEFGGNYKYDYVQRVVEMLRLTSEQYLSSLSATLDTSFFDLGITDSLLLNHAKKCKFLITSDSLLADYARANSIKVYDLVRDRNDRLKRK
jgi:hypothetical protein